MNAEPAIKENDMAHVKMFLMHRPTYDKPLDASGEWPFGWHFNGRKRLWELRAQLRMKVERPAGKIFFGIEMCPGEAAAGHAGRVKSMIQAGLRMTIGKDFYTSSGDTEGGEQEVCHFVMPMWALDQFIISEPGEEPRLDGNLEGLGMRRSNGKNAYIKAMNELETNLSTDKVYTFCFWGISRFMDLEQWCCKGFGAEVDAAAMSGPPPLFVVGYWLKPDEDPDSSKARKHLNSRKTYLCRAALWNDRSPPEPDDLRKAIMVQADEGANLFSMLGL